MKICVYAITKNESKFAERWYNSMKEADEVYVLDTGSTDDTVEKLQKLGVHVKVKVFNPWRFDEARNESLKMVPNDTDLYVCTDLDEVFEPGWRDLLENKYEKGNTKVKYTYNWSFKEDGTPATTYLGDKIHTNVYQWTHPVHEILTLKNNQTEEKIQFIEGIVINHYQDLTKSRGSYLPLLELSVEEDPEDDRNTHYLAREYMYYNKNKEAIEMFHRHLKLPKATWKEERCASMRYMARCYEKLGYEEETIMWYENSIKEAPYLREGYVELATLYCYKQKYQKGLDLIKKALKIKNKSKDYLNEDFAWNEHPYDIYALCSYYLGDKETALKYGKKAVKMNPNDKRLKENLLWYEGKK